MLFNYPAYSINLDPVRTKYIYSLSGAIDIPITIFKASDGSEWWNSNMPRAHPWPIVVITQGMLGCTKSHLVFLVGTAEQGVYIFEDDAELIMPMEVVSSYLSDIMADYSDSWDIILLGANEYVSSKPLTQHINRVYRFWGTHAMIINRNVFELVRRTFEDSLGQGIFLPADWLYNETIKRYSLRVYAPSSPKLFFRQVPGLTSAITGKVRA